MDETVDAARAMVRAGGTHQHVVVNAAKLVEIERNAGLRAAVEGCELVNADGMSVVWASRLLGTPLPERVTGIDLFVRLVDAAHRDGCSVYFLGASDEVVTQVVEVFQARHPGLRVAGWHHGYWDDDATVVAEVRASGADYLFLAIPSPRKELWLQDHLPALGVSFAMGVGGAFDVVAGKTARAPESLQRAGLEWAWRLAQEPRRMWRRYLVTNTAFITMTAREWWRRRR
jgi:N-acetylglucosaminyldiphosphoundecaprenol N-acetyl-beta-D-mannosaminyltransferase